MKFFVSFLTAYIFVISSAFSDSIAFHQSNWQAVKDLAKEQNKYILMYGYFEGCAPCVEMKKNVFTNDTVAAYYNENFISYALNIYADDESKALAKEYEMRGFPTFIFFNSKGELVHRGESFKSSPDFIDLGQSAYDPDRAYVFLKQRYESGESTPALLYQYSKTLMDFDRSDAKKAIITSQIPEGDRLCALVDVEYALAENPRDYIKCTQAALTYGEKYAGSDIRPLTTTALFTVSFSPDNSQHLEAAEKVILMALDYQKDYQHMRIYAQILEKLHKNEEAIAVAQKAITLAQAEGVDHAQMNELVERVTEENN